MPVVVTGASGFLGRQAVQAFMETSPQVRAYVRRPEAAEALRAVGVKVAVGDFTDPDQLAAVMSGAHTVCHLVGGLDLADDRAYVEANLRSTEVMLAAAERAGIVRALYVSYPGASPAASNLYLRAKGLAEEAIRSSSLQHAIIRCTHIYGPGSRWLTATAKAARGPVAVVIGSGRQIVAPLSVWDAAAVLSAADDRASSTSGTWGLEGPDRLTADDLADLLAGRPRHKLHLAKGGRLPRIARSIGLRLGPTLTEVLAADSLADAPDAAAEFGVERTPLAEGLRRSLPA